MQFCFLLAFLFALCKKIQMTYFCMIFKLDVVHSLKSKIEAVLKVTGLQFLSFSLLKASTTINVSLMVPRRCCKRESSVLLLLLCFCGTNYFFFPPYYCYERERAAEPPCTTSIVVLFKAENCKKAIEPYLSPQRLEVRGRRGLFLVLLSPHCLDKKATLPPTFKRYLHKIPFYRTLVKLKRHRPE